MDVNVVCELGLGGHRAAIEPVEPRVNGILIEDRVLDLELELTAEHRVPAACVDHDVGAETDFLAPERKVDRRVLPVGQVDPRYANAFVHRGSELVGMLQKEQVEFGAINVIRVVAVDSQLRSLFKSNVGVGFRCKSFPTDGMYMG